MRVTQSSLSRNYIRNLNRNLSDLASSNTRLSTQRRFTRVSENTADAARAFTIREQLYKNEQFLVNIRDAEGELSSTESNLMSINSILQSVEERLVQSLNGTLSTEDREIMAREVDNLKAQILQIGNAKYGSKYLFGGSNNNTAPFSVDAGDALLFNGVKAEDIVLDPETGKPSIANSDGTFKAVSENADVYIDIGLGLTMKRQDIDSKTALKISTSGIDVLGFGRTEINGTEMPNNIYSLLDKIAADLRSNDTTLLGDDLTHLQNKSKALLINITDIGNREAFLSRSADKIETDILNLKKTQNALEGIKLEEEITTNKSFEMAWMVTLQLGSKIIPPSIFDFMR